MKTVSRVTSVFFILGIWLVLCLIGSFSVFSFVSGLHAKDTTLFVSGSSRNLVVEASEGTKPLVKDAFVANDGRILVVNKFLAKYGSPMKGHGREFVEAADKNGLDWRLLPAIAFQESNLGKKIPKGSYNPFGWAVYTGKNGGAKFTNWSGAINTVAVGIKKDYISRGLHTPEAMVIRYADEHAGWLFGVNSAMEELSSLEN